MECECKGTAPPVRQTVTIYKGSTFFGQLSIKDIKGNEFLVAEGEEITLFFKPTDKTMTKSYFTVTLTSNDEILGNYPFMLSAEQTAAMDSDCYCYAFVRFEDGDYCRILPDTQVKVMTPCEGPLYYGGWNTLIAQVPRVMRDRNRKPGEYILQYAITELNDQNNSKLLLMRSLAYFDIVIVGDCIDTAAVTPSDLVGKIRTLMDTSEIDTCFVAGFFHSDELPAQKAYLSAVKTAFTDCFIDAEALLKTPVENSSGEVIGSRAFDALRQIPNAADIMKILHKEYPDRIMKDAVHFNETGCYAAAKVIMWEAYDRISSDNDNES